MKSVRSVERALDILQSFVTQPSNEVSEIQKSVGLSRPTLYRLLNTLEQKGFLRSSGDPRRYQLSHIAIQLGNAWLSLLDIAQISEPFLHRLWELSGETVALIVPLGERERILAREIPSRNPLSLSLGVGHIAPLHRGTSGKVILAFLPELGLQSVLRSIPGRKERGSLMRALEDIRREKYCISLGEVLVGGASISSPVFDRRGAVVGAVTVFGPMARLTGANQSRCSKLVCRAADDMSTALGFQLDATGPVDSSSAFRRS